MNTLNGKSLRQRPARSPWMLLGSVLAGVILNGCLSGAASAQTVPVPTINSPRAGSIWVGGVKLEVKTASEFEVKTVKAQVGAFEMLVAPVPGSLTSFKDVLPLDTVPYGENTLVITATDAFGTSGSAEVKFFHDHKPVIRVDAPVNDAATKTDLRIAASCSDDDPTGCAQFSVRWKPDGGAFSAPLTAKDGRVDSTVDLAPFNGKSVLIEYRALDMRKQAVADYRKVYVETNVRLDVEHRVDGFITDLRPDKVVFEGRTYSSAGAVVDRSLNLHDRYANENHPLGFQPNSISLYGYATPLGALFVSQEGLYHWKKDQPLETLDTAVKEVALNGSYAKWTATKPSLRLKTMDLGTGLVTDVLGDKNLAGAGVAPNGELFYSLYDQSLTPKKSQLYNWAAGTSTLLLDDTPLANVEPVTDGTHLVYKKVSKTVTTKGTYAIAMLAPGGEEVLSQPATEFVKAVAGKNYQANNGWVAFTQPGTTDQFQVWLRSPEGKFKQVTFFSDSSLLDALGPNGEVTFKRGGRLYWAGFHKDELIDFGSDKGRAFYYDNGWRVAYGNTAFTLETVNVAPAAAPHSVTVKGSAGTEIALPASDLEGTALAYSVVQGPAHGTLGAFVGNKVVYTPTMPYYGPDSFTFKVSDGGKESNTATVSILVLPAKGDANGDGSVNVGDAVKVLRMVAKVDNDADDYLRTAGDVTCDASLNVNDVVQILRVTSGLDTGFSACAE